jgi:hypothetical protein
MTRRTKRTELLVSDAGGLPRLRRTKRTEAPFSYVCSVFFFFTRARHGVSLSRGSREEPNGSGRVIRSREAGAIPAPPVTPNPKGV